MYYPWWFWLPASYYASQTAYGNYGVPPYPPQNWGNVPPPTAGQQGYAQIPGGGGQQQQPAGSPIASGYVEIPGHRVLSPEELVCWSFGRKDTTDYLEDHVLLTVDLARAIGTGQAPDTAALKANAKQWADSMGQVPDQERLQQIMNNIIAKTVIYIAARVTRDEPQMEAARESLRGPLAEEWASFWDRFKVPPKGMTRARFKLLLAQDMKALATDTFSMVEDIVRGNQKDAVRSIRVAKKQATKIGKFLDAADTME